MTFILVSLLFSSCKDDDDDTMEPEDTTMEPEDTTMEPEDTTMEPEDTIEVNTNIEGIWKAKSMTNSGCTDANDNGVVDAASLVCDDATTLFCTEIQFDFKSDGTFVNSTNTIVLGNEFPIPDVSGTYTVTVNDVEICYGTDCQTVTVANDEMTISDSDADSGCTASIVLGKE